LLATRWSAYDAYLVPARASSVQMKALILSGGKGTRLRPLTHTTAKQLITVANRPMLCHVIQQVVDLDINDVGIVIAPETGDQVKKVVDESFPKANITYLTQSEPLGLAHAVKIARPFLGDSPFLMCLGDNLIGQDLKGIVETYHRNEADAVILLKEVKDPRSFGVAEVDENGDVISLVEKPENPASNLALVGFYIFSPAIHTAIDRIKPSQRGELEITDAIHELLREKYVVVSQKLTSWWLDCGKKDDLLEANQIVLDERAVLDIQGTVDESSKIVGRVVLGEGSEIHNSEIRGPVIIGKNTTITGSFVGPFTSIGNSCSINETSIEHSVIADEVTLQNVRRLEDSILGKKAVVTRSPDQQGSVKLMIGDDSEVIL